ncbi:hypothetical protein GCM10007907_18350 [Chitinimonas prasina]|uniref:Uncharacterized protein n=1 Tax=Chitinimonas prasina TaxID=1434937 RepID=A0ABQ5YI59_9NEIS|nr:hypothetical protein GCM10007907_18350 [Chitinimonas prasina]
MAAMQAIEVAYGQGTRPGRMKWDAAKYLHGVERMHSPWEEPAILLVGGLGV